MLESSQKETKTEMTPHHVGRKEIISLNLFSTI